MDSRHRPLVWSHGFAVCLLAVFALTSCMTGREPYGERQESKLFSEPFDTLLPGPVDWWSPWASAGTVTEVVVPQPSELVLRIWDRSGVWVRTLCSAYVQVPGPYFIKWSGRNARGEVVGSGMYFIQVVREDTSYAKKMVLLR